MPGLFVCAPGVCEGPPQVIGWTSAEASRFDRGREPVRIRTAHNPPVGNIANVIEHTFAIRVATLPNGYRGPVIQLKRGQDTAPLPDFTPLVEIDGRPKRAYARDRVLGQDYALQQVPPIELHHYRDSARGRPMWWCPDGVGIQVYPEPDDAYEVWWEPRRTYSLGELGRPRELVGLLPDNVLDALYASRIRGVEQRIGDIAAAPHMARAAVEARVRENAAAMLSAHPGLAQRYYEAARAAEDALRVEAARANDRWSREALMGGHLDQANNLMQQQQHRALTAADIQAAQRAIFGIDPARGPDETVIVTRQWPGVFDNQNYSRIDPETARQSRERARGLLKSLLTPDQWSEFEQAGKVTERIEGCEFTLRPGGMIEAKKPRLMGSVSEKWCVYPNPITQDNDYMPDEDKLIGQLLHLRAGPDELRAKANIFPGARV